MSNHKSLTSPELKVLSTLMGQDRYGLEMVQTIQEAGGRMLLGSLYNILRRLEKNGFVESYWDDNVQERGGNRRRYYKITGAGESVFNNAQSEFMGLWGLSFG